MRKKICKPGEVIFREGDESCEAYWIVSGRVEISVHAGSGGLQVARLGKGEIFGEMGLIDDKPRSATATSIGNTELEVITEGEFEKDVLHDPKRLRCYISTLFERLRATVTLLDLERSRHTAASATVLTPATLPLSGPEHGSEPNVSLTSVGPNPVTHEIISVKVDRFPFRVGRAGDKWSPFFQNELAIEDQKPLQISRQHASFDTGGGKCFVSDRGSRMGTVVNGVQLGVGAGAIVAELKSGENTVIFGHPVSSPHRFTVLVS